ncbi:hypothetical protein [Streptomyces sp. NRRL S-350]|uniref:hypothetical protein n=1 Tax=Streptomyces sp. NRRL S-350 TaxID=1463902 RepID=UPI0004C2A3B4|nr:hypothetical protein [Streptomyces sp. NRRL S-350]
MSRMSRPDPADVIARTLAGYTLPGHPYPGQLPDELAPWHCYVVDSGHCIVVTLPKKNGKPPRERDTVPAPVKAVLRTGWTIHNYTGYVVCDLPYDRDLGLLVDEADTEWDSPAAATEGSTTGGTTAAAWNFMQLELTAPGAAPMIGQGGLTREQALAEVQSLLDRAALSSPLFVQAAETWRRGAVDDTVHAGPFIWAIYEHPADENPTFAAMAWLDDFSQRGTGAPATWTTGGAD